MLDVVTIQPPKDALFSVIWLHGLGADGHDFENIVPELKLPQKEHIRFVFPHAPLKKVTINGNITMRAWYDIFSLDAVSHDYNHNDVKEAVYSINELIFSEISKGIKPKNILISGFSQGGAIAVACGLSYPLKLGGIIALSTYLLPQDDTMLKKQASFLSKIPIFIGHGSSDVVVSINLGKKLCNFLEQISSNVTFREYDMGHSLCVEEINDISEFIFHIFSLK